MNRIMRILRHRWRDETDARRLLGQDALERLAERVRRKEARHSGEIRVCVEAGLPISYLWRGASARERAVAMFGKLRVWDTEHNNGVLIYLLLAEHCIELVADRGIDRKVARERWSEVVGGMQASFAAGRFEEGLNAAIDAVGQLLAEHFPLAADAANPNELPDEPDVR